jgi:hypothetical protein
MKHVKTFFVGNFYSDVQDEETRLQRMDASSVVREYVFQRQRRGIRCLRLLSLSKACSPWRVVGESVRSFLLLACFIAGNPALPLTIE